MISYPQFIPFNPALFGSSLFNLFCRSRKPVPRKILSQFGEIFLAGQGNFHKIYCLSVFIVGSSIRKWDIRETDFPLLFYVHFPCYQPSQMVFYYTEKSLCLSNIRLPFVDLSNNLFKTDNSFNCRELNPDRLNMYQTGR